ncbi:MAG: dipeptidase [Bacteroidales bacterium]|nr:dipeptidase [Bacteroidales bacterium]
MHSVTEFIKRNRDRILDELFGLIRIPSVSSDTQVEKAMHDAAAYLKDHLLSSGADHAEVMETEGWPVVFAQKMVDGSLPTILVYGHYDVQPVDPLEEWLSPPFEPEIREGRIYARGADDDKGQLFMQLKAFEYMVSEDKLPCNVKFLIEGEEEIGSPSLKAFCRKHHKLLGADVILVSDTTMLSLDTPTLTIGLRGLAYFELIVKGPVRDLHSGLYGGAVLNPANVLAGLISNMKDPSGRITIPGFYDDVREVSPEERRLLNALSLDAKKMAGSIQVSALFGEEGFTVTEQLGIRPTLDVNGIWGGFTGEGAKTILPARASAKISMRLVPDQKPERIELLLKKYLQDVVPKGVEFELRALHGGNAYVSPWDSREAAAAIRAIEKTFGIRPLPVRSGGSIPVISDFEEILGIKAVLMGFGLESDAIHSPNENYPLENFFKGIETIPWYFHYYVNS